MTNANETKKATAAEALGVEATAKRLESEHGAADGAKVAHKFARWAPSGSARRAFWREVAKTLESVAE